MDDTLDRTTLATISLLESRLLRIEQILYGPSSPPSVALTEPATSSLADLEERFASLLRRFRVYFELVEIYKLYPSFFQPYTRTPHTTLPPPVELSPENTRATVLAYASAFPSTASALTTVTSETPVPDPKLSAELASLIPRMKGVEAMQLAQEAEMAELRARSERVMRAWYEDRVLQYGQFVASAEGRVEKVEVSIRRAERVREMDAAI
ncbi:hypothetical protein B0T26DRAFT_747228 [Lasiosphaeria miniovina]|uniref:Nuclear distribution protein n=1 Tax=Lasiosphaeria miniovina TaxID=1954250 RepID=A0AA40B365_9PEZI|nr:uncharacterized protein B0T26DRAFT_747228 [Lasiosphaeria miniovina]KAK0726837.1 hypothetical protein B0T26DRAFT_747228 [Lasiosphaeria miniovina]